MALEVVITNRVQVAFTVGDPDRPEHPTFSDALYFPQGQVPGQAALRQLATDRYREWRRVVDVRPPRPPRAERLAALREARDLAAAQAAAAAAQLAAEEAEPEPEPV